MQHGDTSRNSFLVMGSIGAIAIAYWSWVLQPYYTIPSAADGINHLSFVRFLIDQSRWSIAGIPLEHPNEFGAGSLGFYPAGMHAILALVCRGFARAGIFIDLGTLLKGVAIGFLALLPVASFHGITKLEPKITPGIAAMIALAMGTQWIFPAAPLGEGGLPRIVAQVIALFIALLALNQAFTRKRWLAVIAFGVPALFYIHPSSFFVLFPALILRFPLDYKLLGALLAAAIGCILPVLGGPIDPAQLGVSSVANGTWSSRWIALIHFLFEDGHGFGKFVSPRSLLIYSGIVFALSLKSKRVYVWLLLIPFILVLCALSPWSLLQIPGGLYYQSVKRIAEMGYLPLLLLAAAGTRWLIGRLSRRALSTAFSTGPIFILWTLIAIVSAWKCQQTVQSVAELYQTPRIATVHQLNELLAHTASTTVIISDQPWVGVIRGIRPDLAFVGGSGECVPQQNKTHCKDRLQFVASARAAVTSGQLLVTDQFNGRALLFVELTTAGVIAATLRQESLTIQK